MSKVAEFPWSLFLGEPHSSLERERKIRRRLFIDYEQSPIFPQG